VHAVGAGHGLAHAHGDRDEDEHAGGADLLAAPQEAVRNGRGDGANGSLPGAGSMLGRAAVVPGAGHAGARARAAETGAGSLRVRETASSLAMSGSVQGGAGMTGAERRRRGGAAEHLNPFLLYSTKRPAGRPTLLWTATGTPM